jgi:uncharacterized protein
MLELRPTCEHCNQPLPPAATNARICTYECCGGGFVPRPIRPVNNWKGDNFLGKDPASATVRHRPVDPHTHAKFSARIKSIPPERR